MNNEKSTVYKIVSQLAISSGLLIHFPMLYVITEDTPYPNEMSVPLVAGYFLLMIVGIFFNILSKGYNAFKNQSFYGASLVTVLPVLGPISAVFILYLLPHKGEAVSELESSQGEAVSIKVDEGRKAGATVVFVALGIFAVFWYLVSAPGFSSYGNMAYASAVRSDLKNLHSAEQEYFYENKTYAKNLIELGFTHMSKDVTIEIVIAGKKCFKAKGNHVKLDETYWIDCEGKLYRQEEGSSELVQM